MESPLNKKILIIEVDPYPEYRSSHYEELASYGADLYFLLTQATFASFYAPRVRVADQPTGNSLLAAAQAWHAEEGFDAVIAIDELSVIPAAMTAQAIGLPGISPATAQKSRNKFLMRQAHQAHQAPCPQFRLIDSLEAALEAADELGFPLILKPTLGASSEHVYRVDSPEELKALHPIAQAGISQSCCAAKELPDLPIGPNTLLLETFLDGSEHCVEAVIWDGELKIGSIADRISTESTTFDNDLHTTPTALDAQQIEMVRQALHRGAMAQGIHRSVLHAEFRFHQGSPYILEIAPRLGGGSLFRMAQIAYSYRPLKSTFEIALNQQPIFPELQPTGKVTAGLSMLCEPGTILKLNVPPEVTNHPNVFNFKLLKFAGEEVKRPPNGNDILGYIGTQGNSLAEAVSWANALHQKIELELG